MVLDVLEGAAEELEGSPTLVAEPGALEDPLLPLDATFELELLDCPKPGRNPAFDDAIPALQERIEPQTVL